MVAIGLLLTLIGTIGVATASASTNDATIQDPGETSAMMTQASEGILNKLASQDDKLNNQLVNTFGFY